jgi:glucokinase
MSASNLYVGLDVGGTTMKAAVVRDDGTPFDTFSMKTEPERGQDEGLRRMAETIRGAVSVAGKTMADIAGIGVATPGLMDIKLGVMLDPPNFPGWKNVKVLEFIKDTFQKPTVYQNDANAAAFGEYWVGAGKGMKIQSMVMFTLGTGVGGGIVLNGRVHDGEHSHGGELGHMRIDLPDRGRLCGCGRRGCLEAYASATAVVARTREEAASYRMPSQLRGKLAKLGNNFEAKDVFDLQATDPLSRKIVEDTAYYLAMGVCNVIATIDPQLIVIGGGMAESGESFLNTVREYVGRYGLSYPAGKVQIKAAMAGTSAGYIGAAGCVRAMVLSKA